LVKSFTTLSETLNEATGNASAQDLWSSLESRLDLDSGMASSWLFEAAQSLVPTLKLMALSFARK
jgi:hypothetical protein